MSADLSMAVSETLADVPAAGWNELVGPDNPFFEHEFLYGLEAAGCVGPETAWHPRYLLARDGRGLVGAVPFFLKYDSYGEYIFDWQWADAYQRSGIPYYPKAVAAVPFTPVTGERLMVAGRADFEETAACMTRRLLEWVAAERLSGLHVLFPAARDQQALVEAGLMERLTHQFHWENRGYGSFEDYLNDLRSKKRKQVRRERAEVERSGLHVELLTGDSIGEEHIEAMWGFYVETTSRKWGERYLNRAFFDRLGRHFRHRLVMVMARDGQNWVGGSLNVAKGKRLFGRYWGSRGHHPSLHFECCFYRLIEYAIENRVEVFEAGAQGEQKFLRGFAARPTYSAHWLAHAGGRSAVGDYLEAERRQTAQTISGYNAVSPLKPVRSAALE